MIKLYKVGASFLLILCLCRGLHAQGDTDPAQLESSIREMHQQIGADELSFDVFRIAYLKYISFKKKGELGSSSLMTVVDFTKPSSKERMFVMDVGSNPSLKLQTLVAHGLKSGVVMAENFSNVPESNKSSKQFYVTGNPYQSSKVGYALKLHGQDSGINDNIFSRGIVLHRGIYVTPERASKGAIGRSLGCLAVPTEHNRYLVNTLKGKTLIYVHTMDSNFNPTIKPEDVTAEREIKANSTAPESFSADDNPPITYENTPEFDEIRDQETIGAKKGINAVPLLGALAVPAALQSGDDVQTIPPAPEEIVAEKQGFADYHGTEGFETCQNLASEDWCKIVEATNRGEDPHKFFDASWNDLQGKMENSDHIEDWRAANMAENHLGMIRECAAMVHLTNQTDCSKENINEEDKRASKDGAIECQYLGPESQDYTQCVKTVEGYEGILEEEKVLQKSQSINFKGMGAAVTDSLKNSKDAQKDALTNQQQLTAKQGEIATERGDFNMAKAKYLQSALGKFPTRQSLLDNCRNKYKNHSDGGKKLYEAFTRQFRANPKVPTLPDPCFNAISRVNPTLVQNVKARNNIKKVVKAAGLVAQDYYDKNNILTGQSRQLNNTMGSYAIDGPDLVDTSRFQIKCKPEDKDCQKKAKAKLEREQRVRESSSALSNSSGDLFQKTSGSSASNSSSNSEREIMRRQKSGIHDEFLYVKMDKVITYPTEKNLISIQPEVDEFGRYYNYKDLIGAVPVYSKKKIEPFLSKNGIETRAVRKKYSSKISGRRELWYKKDGTLFEFDIHKKQEGSLWDIISNRYRKVYR